MFCFQLKSKETRLASAKLCGGLSRIKRRKGSQKTQTETQAKKQKWVRKGKENGAYLISESHLPRNDGHDVHFHNQDRAVERKRQEHFVLHHPCGEAQSHPGRLQRFQPPGAPAWAARALQGQGQRRVSGAAGRSRGVSALLFSRCNPTAPRSWEEANNE